MKHLLFSIGLAVVLGSILACDTETIELAQAVKQCLVGLPMIALGVR